ncbi:hypothetical protein FHY30_001894 [Xanthomonas arboricola]|uniref:hypothetical protein n=1 Tax=Xanthomonas campestris TaxID=339 RepID=UPI0023E9CDD8|nr:hypothetical protein [Xanthomonas campestris]
MLHEVQLGPVLCHRYLAAPQPERLSSAARIMGVVAFRNTHESCCGNANCLVIAVVAAVFAAVFAVVHALKL